MTTKRTVRITRDNMINNVFRVRRELENDSQDMGELRRLLDEALHLIVRQNESMTQSRRAALEAYSAASQPLMPSSKTYC